MAYAGDLIFKTGVDGTGFQAGINQITDIVKGLGAFELLKKGLDMVTESIGKAMSRVDTMEQFSRVMNTMTGSADVTNAALNRTKDIVTGTAYGLDIAARSVQNFVSRGMEVDSATETVERWGDAVAFFGDGTNASFSSVTDALSKMQTKGNVTMEHLEMLFNAGIPAIELYADAMNMSTQEVTDIMGRGALKSSEFIAVMNSALESGTSKFPALAGAAKEAGASWSGTFDNMHAAITRGVQSIITAIDETNAAVGNPTMRESITAFGKAFESALNWVAKAIKPVIANLDILSAAAIAAGASAAIVGASATAWKAFTAFQKKAETATNLLTAAQKAAAKAGVALTAVTDEKTLSDERDAAITRIKTRVTNEDAVSEARKAAMVKLTEKATNAQAIAEAKSFAAIKLGTEATEEQIDAEAKKIVAMKLKKATTEANIKAEANSIITANLKKATTEKEIVAEMASTGVISAKTVALGGLSAKMGIATVTSSVFKVATEALNTAIKLNPIGFWTTAISLAVSAIVGLVKWMEKSDTEFQKQKEAVEEMTKAQTEYTDACKNGQKAFEEKLSAMENEATVAQDLISKIKILSSAQTRSGSEKRLLASYVKSLNQAQEGLNLSYDEEADALSMSTSQVEKYIAAKKKISEVNVYAERRNELMKDELRLQENLAIQQSKIDELHSAQKLETTAYGYIKYEQQLNALTKSKEEYVAQQEENAERLAYVDEKIKTSDTTAAQQILDNAAAEKEAAEATAQAVEASAQRREDAIASFMQAATNMFEAINVQSNVNAEQMLSNLQKNADALTNYETNMTGLRDRFSVLHLDTAVLEQLANMDAEGIKYVAALASGTDEQLKGIVASFAGNTSAAVSAGITSLEAGYPGMSAAGQGASGAMADGYAAGAQNVTGAVTSSVANTKAATDSAVASADFQSSGASIPQNVEAGLEAQQPALSEAMGTAVAQTSEATKSAIAASDFGADGSRIITDMATGAEGNSALAQSASAAVQTAKIATSSQVAACDFSSIGMQMINGITQGVRSGASRLVDALVSATNNAYLAAKSSLRINSPSKLFRDKIGLPIMEGWAIGIERGETGVVNRILGTIGEITNRAQAVSFGAPQMNPAATVSTMRTGVMANQASLARMNSSIPVATVQASYARSDSGAGLSQAIAAPQHVTVTTPVVVEINSREILKCTKEAEATIGYNVGGMQYAW